MKAIKGVFTAVFFLVGVCSSHAELYRYQDERGRWHYTDKKPENQKVDTNYQLKEANITAGAKGGKVVVHVPDHLCPPDQARANSFKSSTWRWISRLNTARALKTRSVREARKYH